MEYLDEQGNLSMKLRVLSLQISDPYALMKCLMSLDPSCASKINRVCKDGINPVLGFSMYEGMEIMIRLIAHAHANLDVVGIGGQTPLTIACENGF